MTYTSGLTGWVKHRFWLDDLHTGFGWMCYTQDLFEWAMHRNCLDELNTWFGWIIYTQGMTRWSKDRVWLYALRPGFVWMSCTRCLAGWVIKQGFFFFFNPNSMEQYLRITIFKAGKRSLNEGSMRHQTLFLLFYIVLVWALVSKYKQMYKFRFGSGIVRSQFIPRLRFLILYIIFNVN